MWRKTVIPVVILLVGVIFAGVWFSSAPKEKFGIYLQRNNELVIADEDIVLYDASDYGIKLTPKGAERISSLHVGVYGEPFAVRIGETEIYGGAFWAPISSVSYHGVVIVKPVEWTDTIQFQWGYPPSSLGSGDNDPRDDPRIVSHFQKVGKLTN